MLFIACIDGLTGFPEAIAENSSPALYRSYGAKFTTLCVLERQKRSRCRTQEYLYRDRSQTSTGNLCEQ